MTHVTCRLTAKNRDQLRNPTIGNRVWATFFYPDSPRQMAIKWVHVCAIISWLSVGFRVHSKLPLRYIPFMSLFKSHCLFCEKFTLIVITYLTAFSATAFSAVTLFLASVKSRLVLLFCYRLTRVVPDKELLNGCVCVVITYQSDAISGSLYLP